VGDVAMRSLTWCGSCSLRGLTNVVIRRFGSGGGMERYSAAWAEKVRMGSNISNAEEPPRGPLPEEHDLGEGVADFANWLDRYEDVSVVQAVVSVALAASGLVLVHRLAKGTVNEPWFTPRELPHLEKDLPFGRETTYVTPRSQ